MSTRTIERYSSEAVRTSRYGAAALDRACESIRRATEGSRNPTLFRESVGIFELVAGGVLELKPTEAALFEAARVTDLKPKEIHGVLKSAQRTGFQRPRRPPDRISFDMLMRRSLPPKTPARRPQTPKYPPHAEIVWLWQQGKGVSSDDGVCAWLLRRGLDPDLVAEFRLLRVLPTGLAWPGSIPKVQGFGEWRRAPEWGLRAMVSLHDAKGIMRSVVFRRVFEMSKNHPRYSEAPPKVRHPRGERAGLVMANTPALAMLREGGVPAPFRGAALEIVIAEGEMDWLAVSIEPPGLETVRGVFGICSGSWRSEHARLIPTNARVIIATDQDEPGERYAEQVRATFTSRQVAIGRWRPKLAGQDLCDAGGVRGGCVHWEVSP